MADTRPFLLCNDMKGHEHEVAVLAEALGGGTIAVRHAEHLLRQLWSSGMWIVDNGEQSNPMPGQTGFGFGQPDERTVNPTTS
jgi:hypothetical protein